MIALRPAGQSISAGVIGSERDRSYVEIDRA
jgi:hypothetical protein